MWFPGTKFRSSGPAASRVISLVGLSLLGAGRATVWLHHVGPRDQTQSCSLGKEGLYCGNPRHLGLGGGDMRGQVSTAFSVSLASCFYCFEEPLKVFKSPHHTAETVVGKGVNAQRQHIPFSQPPGFSPHRNRCARSVWAFLVYLLYGIHACFS